jgi:hypothetical protein
VLAIIELAAHPHRKMRRDIVPSPASLPGNDFLLLQRPQRHALPRLSCGQPPVLSHAKSADVSQHHIHPHKQSEEKRKQIHSARAARNAFIRTAGPALQAFKPIQT